MGILREEEMPARHRLIMIIEHAVSTYLKKVQPRNFSVRSPGKLKFGLTSWLD